MYVYETADFNRIKALPRRLPPTEVEAQQLCQKWYNKLATHALSCNCTQTGRPCCKELKPVQGVALEEISQVGGLIGPIGVGHGKTLLDLLSSLAAPGVSRGVLLVPPSLRDQLLRFDVPYYAQHWKLPNIVADGFSTPCYYPERPELHVLSYSTLSNAKGTAILEKINPDLIIADEAHNLRNTAATRTKRFLRYMRAHPHVRLCAWSGTLVARSLRDWAETSKLALREGSPVPTYYPDVEMWARALDPVSNTTEQYAPGCLVKLAHGSENARDAVQRRILETKGVVSSGDKSSCNASLVINAVKFPVPAEVQRSLSRLENAWELPDGRELFCTFDKYRAARTLSLGFYHYWEWPNGESPELQREWLSARGAWLEECSERLKRSRAHMDSPLLLYKAAKRAHENKKHEDEAPVWKSETWEHWHNIRPLARPRTRVKWVSEFAIQRAREWGAGGRGLVWVDYPEFGSRLSAGICAPFFGGGSSGRAVEEFTGPIAIVSGQAHGTGKNLQRWNRNLFTTPPSSGAEWEQRLGRTHRYGQQADEVVFDVWQHTQYLIDAVDRAGELAIFIQSQFGNEQKLVNKAQWVGFENKKDKNYEL